MKEVQIVYPEFIEVTKVEEPKVKPNQLLIKINAVGICGTDLKIYNGSISYLKDGLLKLPHVPGHEWVGEIVQLGSLTSKFKLGDRVTGECHIGCGNCEECKSGRANICAKRLRFGILQDGAMAEFIVLPEEAVYKIPDNVTDEEATLIEPLTVALFALDKLDKIVGSTVLVTGLGPIGLLIGQLSKLMGASKVIGVDINDYALNMAKHIGYDMVINSTNENLEKRSKTLTDNLGPDIIVEATGAHKMLSEILKMVKPGGQVSLIGLYNQTVEIDANLIISKDIKLYGNMASTQVWNRTIKLLASKKLDVSKLITHRMKIDDADKAFKIASEKKDNVIKVVLKF